MQVNRLTIGTRLALKNKEGVSMSRFQLARFASLVCLAGGVLQIIYGLLAIPFSPSTAYVNTLGWDEALWALINVGMIGAVVGLLALDVARPRWLVGVGATLTILGNLIRIGAALWNFVGRTSVADAPTTPFIVLSVFLLVGGLAILGVTTLLGKRLSGWQAWAPLLAGGFALITAVVFSINLYLHFILLGLWGLPWLLVGYVVFTYAARQQQAQHNIVPGATAHP
jgi:hypothetical protein